MMADFPENELVIVDKFSTKTEMEELMTRVRLFEQARVDDTR